MSSLHSEEYRALIGRLVTARKDAGVTQVELAARIGKSQSFVTKVEQCQRRIDVYEFVLIARALKADWVAIIDPNRS